MDKYLKALDEYFGYPGFRANQEEIIRALDQKEDILAVLHTGLGKSICFQLPGLINPGITIVVTPLISLMVDQVEELKKKKIKAAYISSFTDPLILRDIYLNFAKYKFIYVSPERLSNQEFNDYIRKIEISYLIIDEAHCCSIWGFDFRKSYLDILTFKNSLKNKPIVGAFTATAGRDIIDDVVNILGLNKPKLFITSPIRENLYYNIYKPKDKWLYLLKYLAKNQSEKIVIYALTIKTCEALYKALNDYHFKASIYHGKLDNIRRNNEQEDFFSNKNNIMVSTSAFGLGVNIKNIRHVIIYEMPLQIEDLVQQWGRAGRDGLKANCILLFKEEDIKKCEFLIGYTKDKNILKRKYKYLDKMIELANLKTCITKYIASYFGFKYLEKCDRCCNCKK